MDGDLRDEVIGRAAGRCDICGRLLDPEAWECHHRKLRSQGGRDTLANLLALHTGCHEQAHHHRSWARDRGYIVASTDEPDSCPVWLHDREWNYPGPSWSAA